MELSASVSVLLENRGDENSRNETRFSDLGELEQSAAAFTHDDAVVLSSSILSLSLIARLYINIYDIYIIL